MERNARYFMVGLFVIVTTLAGFLFAGLFYKQQPRQQFAQYELHFNTSVEGLSQGSEVRYLGVKVGDVREVFLLADSAGVGVRIRIAANTPVNNATVATLRQQGLTGVTFVHLFQ
ncbi:MAG: MlaD family protein, partial [Thiothrix sp.]